MADLWDQAIRDAGEEPPADLGAAAREELAALWFDLEHEMTFAMNGRWSIACDNLVQRIVRLSRLVAPTPWGQVPVSLLLNETYQRIYAAAGVSFFSPTREDLQELAAMTDVHR
jgi:hypothetical protein